MGWPDEPTAQSALQTLIGDGPTDKLCYNKKLIGVQNGTNLTFKTFEFRRTTQFESASAPLGVFKNGTILANNAFASDDYGGTGAFTLTGSSGGTAPVATDDFRATYYYQWFTSTELDQFLQNAASWLTSSTTYISLPPGLNAAALRFAAQEAYLKAAMKYSTRASEGYKLEDAPTEDILKSIAAFKDMASGFMAAAEKLRDDYYTRQGQNLQPLYGLSTGSVCDPVPRR